jgi:hypothetical protein
MNAMNTLKNSQYGRKLAFRRFSNNAIQKEVKKPTTQIFQLRKNRKNSQQTFSKEEIDLK